MQIKILKKLLPKPVVFHMAKAFRWPCPPMLVTFRDTKGKIRQEAIPL